MWERGLKPLWLQVLIYLVVSLPVWERGLKLYILAFTIRYTQSLPVWERGLKLMVTFILVVVICRSPCGSVD